MNRLDFLDISHWQGPVDHEALACGGILGVIAKCTERTNYFDPTYLTHRAGALSAGLAFASYHFLQHGDVDAQIDWYLSHAEARVGERVVIDYEADSLTIDDLEVSVAALRRARPDLEISVYGSAKLTEDVNAAGDVSWLDGTSLWIARYSTQEPVIGNAWEYWSAWQYSQTGCVPGIDGDVDLNTFNGSRAACLAWFGPPDFLDALNAAAD